MQQPEPDPLRQRVAEIQQRLRAVAVARAGVIALFWAACAFAAVALADRLVWLDVPLPALGAAALVSAGVAGLVAGARRRPTAVEAALAADAQAHLKERLSSALTLGEPETGMERALLADARARAEAVRVDEAAPFRPPRVVRWLPAPVLLGLLAVFFLPQGDLFGRKAAAAAAAADAAVLKEQARKLELKREEILERAKAKKTDEAPRAARELEKIAELMKAPDTDRKEAMAKLSTLADELKADKDELSRKLESARQAMNALAKGDPKTETPLERLVREGEFGQAAKELEAMRDKLAKGELSPEEQDRLREALGRMGDALAEQLDRKRPDGSGAPDLRDLAKGLRDASRGLGEGGERKPGDQADRALQDLARGLDGLDSDLGDLESMQDLLRDLDDLKDGLAQDEQPCDGPSGEG